MDASDYLADAAPAGEPGDGQLPRMYADMVSEITGEGWAHVATYGSAAKALMYCLPGAMTREQERTRISG